MSTAEEDTLEAQLTREVTLLLTKLVTTVAKQLELDERNLHLHKENLQLKTLKESAEEENKKLQAEVEELTESLFSEANEMVSNASRETYNFKIKNRKLYEELDEKNAIIDNLQDQLRDLKALFIKLEDQQRLTFTKSGTPKLENLQFSETTAGEKDPENGEKKDSYSQLQALIYLPNVRAVRFDLDHYQQDFKGFIFQLIKPDFTFDLATLKNLRFFRKIWTEELENSITNIPTLNTSNFINRWQKGKNFWNLIVEGKAAIEPISGVNETFKLTYKGKSRTQDAPVALKDPCTFCGEAKEDVLEHARLYTLKLMSPDNLAYGVKAESEVIASYPLCNFCLIKLRNICEFFAKLRLIHANVYKFKQNSLFDDTAFVSNFQFKRASSGGYNSAGQHLSEWEKHSQPKAKLDTTEESVLMKIYVMLVLIRNKIFWSKIGFWDNAEDVEELNLDELHPDVFRTIIAEGAPADEAKEVVAEAREDTVTGEAKEGEKSGTVASKENEKAGVFASEEAERAPELQTTEDLRTEKSSGEDEEFADTSDTFGEPPAAPGAETPEPKTDIKISRKKSKSKQFKKKMDSDLNATLAMLQESIDPEEKRENEK